MKPIFDERNLASCESLIDARSAPATSIAPFVGRSRPAIRLSSVDLPEPDGPMSASNEPSGTSRSRLSRTLIGSLLRQKVLAIPLSLTIGFGAAAGER